MYSRHVLKLLNYNDSSDDDPFSGRDGGSSGGGGGGRGRDGDDGGGGGGGGAGDDRRGGGGGSGGDRDLEQNSAKRRKVTDRLFGALWDTVLREDDAVRLVEQSLSMHSSSLLTKQDELGRTLLHYAGNLI